jgi:cytochrome P450
VRFAFRYSTMETQMKTFFFSFISIIMLAGHETVSKSLSFSLLELAKHPEIQRKLRDEIRKTQAARGNVELTVEDFDRMPYLSAFIKVCLSITTVFFYSHC